MKGEHRACCWKCRANFTSIPFTDFSGGALWRSTLVRNGQYLLEQFQNGGYVSKLFDIPGFEAEYISADLMHCSDLGVLQYLLGSVLLELFYEMGGAVTRPEPVLGEIVLLIKKASKALQQDRPPINTLTMTMIRGRSGPKLKTKAAEGRSLLNCVEFILRVWFPVATYPVAKRAHAELRYSCASSIYNMCEAHLFFLFLFLP